jgi:ketosteroid isomerase-like protein
MISLRFVVAAALVGTMAGGSSSLPGQAIPAPPPPAAEMAIRRSLAEMRTAAERMDAEALYAFVLDTSVPPVIENGELAATRHVALERTTLDFRGLASLAYAYEQESIVLLSATTALWIGSGTGRARLEDGRELSVPFAETVVLLEDAGRWKVLHAHRSVPNRQ